MKQLLFRIILVTCLGILIACRSNDGGTPSSSVSSNKVDQNSSDSNIELIESTNNKGDESEMEKNKVLIAYFSLVDIVPSDADASAHATPAIGNTEAVATEIQKQVGGDLFAIQTIKSYPVSHRECSAIAEQEMRDDERPELATYVENMNEYDTIYLGYPIWWYAEPMAIRTFIEEYDFTGKTIIPFCTTLGANITESQENISQIAENATVIEGITVRTGQDDVSDEINAWLQTIIND